MNLVVVGPESTGGRYLSTQLRKLSDVSVRHWSMPHGPSRGDRFWPTDRDFDDWDFDHAILTIRSWHPMVLSAQKEHTNDLAMAEMNVRYALWSCINWFVEHEVDWRVVTYESLADKRAFATLCRWLGREEVEIDPFVDGNAKWYDLD